MALNPAKLKQGLVDVNGSGKNFPKTPLEAAKRWARAYASYAADAMSLGGAAPVPLTPNEASLAAALTVVFSNPNSLPPQTAQVYAAAFTAFWFSPPVAFPLTPVGTPLPPPVLPGIVTVVGGSAALPGLLLAAWASNFAARAPDSVAMTKLASVLDTFTRTVIVTHLISVPGPPIVGPIS